MGKLHLLNTYVYGDRSHTRKGKKRLTMSTEANYMIFLKVQ